MTNKIIDKENEINSDDVKNKTFYIKLFEKKKYIISILSKYYEKYRIEEIKFFNLIIGYIKQSHNKADLKKIIQFIDDKFLKKDIFYLKKENKNIMIPIYFLKKTENNKDFKSLFLEKLGDYCIDDETIFSEEKKNKFLLLEEMNENNYCINKNDYKKKTISYINKKIDNREELIHKKSVIIYNNSQKYRLNEQNKEEYYYYSKIINLIDKDKLKYTIHEFLIKVGNNLNYINSLKDIKKYFEFFFIKTKLKEYNKISKYIKILEESNIKAKGDEKYKDYRDIYFKYKPKLDDLKLLDSKSFIKIYCSFKESKKYDEEECLEKAKEKFKELEKIFENKNIEEKMKDKDIREFLLIKDKNDLLNEISILKELLKIKKNKDEIEILSDEIITFESYSDVKNIISGLALCLESFNINDKLYIVIKDINKNLNDNKRQRTLDDIK